MNIYSKRNRVHVRNDNGRLTVGKRFASAGDWQRELDVYRLLKEGPPAPKVLESRPGFLRLEYLELPTLLQVLERQERERFDAAPWTALAEWLTDLHSRTGLVPGDGNLRNFLWDEAKKVVYGIDFEGYATGRLCDGGAQTVAFLLEYKPLHTPVKRQAAAVMSELLPISETDIERNRASLHRRRTQKERPAYPCSFILLAGGKSSRMGCDKAKLIFQGKSFLQIQIEKARSLGIEDILLSGYPHSVPEIKSVPDQYPERGPLGGLHAGLAQAEHSCCLVLSVDVPLVPTETLARLIELHTKGGAKVTLLKHRGIYEPLIGVYDSDLTNQIEDMLHGSGASIWKLLDEVRWQTLTYCGQESLLLNCNTIKEYEALCDSVSVMNSRFA